MGTNLSETNVGNGEKEECPVCAERGEHELRSYRVEQAEGKVTKRYSPCGHKLVTVTVEDKIMLSELASVNPKTAKQVVSALLSIGYKAEKEKGEPELPVNLFDRIDKSMDMYETAVNTVLANLGKNAAIDIMYIIVTLLLVIAAAIWSNIAGLVTSLGLGGVTATTQGKAWVETLRNFNDSTTRLKLSVNNLRRKLSLCDKNDKACLDAVGCLIDKASDTLETASAK